MIKRQQGIRPLPPSYEELEQRCERYKELLDRSIASNKKALEIAESYEKELNKLKSLNTLGHWCTWIVYAVVLAFVWWYKS